MGYEFFLVGWVKFGSGFELATHIHNEELEQGILIVLVILFYNALRVIVGPL